VRRVGLWLLVGTALLAVGPTVGTAAAHATLVGTEPAEDEVVPDLPPVVTLTFDGPVVVDDAGVSVLDPGGRPVEQGDPGSGERGRVVSQSLRSGGPDGTYTVSYRVLSDDGHVISGSFVFHVGTRTGTGVAAEDPALPGLLGALGRWTALAGAILAGGVLAMALVVDRGPTGLWTGGPTSSRQLLLPASVAVLAGTTLALVASAVELAGGSVPDGIAGLGDLVGSGRTGAVAGLRVLVALVLLLAVAGSSLLVRAPWLAAVAVLAALALPSFAGHAATASPAAVAVAADVLHVLAAAVWVGGLGVVALTWDADGARLRRYSRMALVAAPLVVLSGVVGAAVNVAEVSDLLDTDYGRLLLVKAAGAAVVLLFGLTHRRQLSRSPASVGRLRPTVRVEALVGLGVLAVTAVLVVTPPPRDLGSGPVGFEADAVAGTTRARLQVVPARSGPNQVHLYYTSPDGSPAEVDASELTVATDGVEPRRIPLTPITTSHVTALDVALTPGTWRFELTVVRRGEPERATFEVPVT
jgi:copper transport protein